MTDPHTAPQHRARPDAALAALMAALMVVLMPLAGCEEGGARSSAAVEGTGAGAAMDSARATQAALPGLFDIMMGLQQDMEDVSRGIWRGNLGLTERAARSIADHPRVSADELRVVRGALGDSITHFRTLDVQVHDLAVRLAEDAASGDMEAVLATDAELRAACVECHQVFRGRLRAGIQR